MPRVATWLRYPEDDGVFLRDGHGGRLCPADLGGHAAFVDGAGPGGDPGREENSKTIPAPMPTAFSLDYAVSIQMDNTPEVTNTQVIDSCGVTAP